MTERVIGVDFGASTSVVHVKLYQDGNPSGEDPLRTMNVTFHNSPTVPTLIQRREGLKPYFGMEALVGRKGYTLHDNFKMRLESVNFQEREQAREDTGAFLAHMAEEYLAQRDNGHLGSAESERTIISYPVKWSEKTKAFMLEAAKAAGFPNVEGMNEAEAAIHAVMVQNTQSLIQHKLLADGVPVHILLIDMGAGTTDLALCKFTPGDKTSLEVLKTWPESDGIQFGGRDVDRLLPEFFCSRLSVEQAEQLKPRVKPDEWKTWKETMVSPALARSESVMDFSRLDEVCDDLHIKLDYRLDRAAFDTNSAIKSR